MKLSAVLRAACAFAIVTSLTIEPANAAVVGNNIGLIVRLGTYADYGNGDVGVWVQTPWSNCDGFWFRTTEANGKEIYAQLLSAQLAQKPMYIYAHEELLWSGTSSHFCKISLVMNP